MKTYLYSLQKGSKKWRCPRCGKKTLVRFIDNESGTLLSDEFGRCDREAKCRYYKNPYSIYSNTYKREPAVYRRISIRPEVSSQAPIKTHLPKKVLNQTTLPDRLFKSLFFENLVQLPIFKERKQEAQAVWSLYRLGTILSGSFKTAVTFPFIDSKGNIRAIQAKLFDDENHTLKTSFIHSIITENLHKQGKLIPKWLSNYNNQERKVDCLFGEHLLATFPSNPVILVEAPKTAIYGTVYSGIADNEEKPIWLATYNLSALSLKRCAVLRNRNVLLVPDLSQNGEVWQRWNEKAEYFNKYVPGANFRASSILEENASEEDKNRGADFADFLARLSPNTLRSKDQNSKTSVADKPFWKSLTSTEILRALGDDELD